MPTHRSPRCLSSGLPSSLPQASPASRPYRRTFAVSAPLVVALIGVPDAALAGSASTASTGASGYPLRWVPSGTTTLGCTPGQGGDCFDSERPARSVIQSRALWVGETEVTQGLYGRVMGNNPSKFSACGPACPVENLSWFDAVTFANKLSAVEGLEPCYVILGEQVSWPKGVACLGYRLPTDAEWEVAARGGQDPKYAGGDTLGVVGWYVENSGGQTHPVAQKAPNGYGLYDMSGNVWEWVWDWRGRLGEAVGPVTDPLGPATGDDRVCRGGGWSLEPVVHRVAYRGSNTPQHHYWDLGLRLVRTAG